MKKFVVAATCALLVLLPTTFVRADLLTEYGINIEDTNNFSDNINLFQLFNNYFADQLGSGGLYTGSNELFLDRGVDPYTDWTTSSSQLVGAFKVADLGHQLNMLDSSDNLVAGLMHVGGTANIGQADGITDLSGQSVIDIADGLHVNFQLNAYWGDTLVYSWASTPDQNDGSLGLPGDGMVHMLAMDITDLYNAKYGTTNDSVYMFAWEDLHLTAAGGGQPADWDYQDFVAIMTNVRPNSEIQATPEPATMVMFGLGGLVGALAYRRRKRWD